MERLLSFTMLALVASTGIAASAPHFVFRKGDVLTYGVTVRAGDQALDGIVTLTVLEAKADGTARIELAASGTGRLTINGRLTPLEEARSSVVMVAKPNGTILQFLDSSGRPVSMKERRKSLFAADGLVGDKVAVMRTLFGLQLPSTSVAIGGKWTGYQQAESATSADLQHWQTQLEPVPVTYTFAGTREYQGRSCMVITYSVPAMSPDGTMSSIPTTIFFDASRGQVVGTTTGGSSSSQEPMIDTVVLKSYILADGSAEKPAP